MDGNERESAPGGADAAGPTVPQPGPEAQPRGARGRGRRARAGAGEQPGGTGAGGSGPAPTYHVPGQLRDGRADDRAGTIVLGGAAAAEGRTTGPGPRITGPGSGTSRPSPTGEEAGGDAAGDRGRHFPTVGGRPWWPLALAAVPIGALALLVGAWAIDAAVLSGQVMRNVSVAGHSVGGLGEQSLPDVMSEVDAELAVRPVTVTSGDRVYETTAGEIGLSVDADATTEAALEAGRDQPIVVRPVTWLTSFFSPRTVDPELTVAQAQVTSELTELQGDDVVAASNPTIQLGPEGWALVPGTPGEGIDPEQVAAELPSAARADPEAAIEVEADRMAIAPEFPDEAAQALADRANALTAAGITLRAGEATAEVGAGQLRTWIAPATEGGELDLAIRPDVVNAEVPDLFAGLRAEAADASFDLQGGRPVVVPSHQGVACCGPDSAELVWQALLNGQAEADLQVSITEPELTTEEAEGLGITQAVGGNHAWRDGAPTTAGPGFTTYHAAGQARVTNIHRMADLVRGALVLPGETFSINDHVGRRTEAKGFVPAGAIRDGEHVDEVGGGVSQFATTMFNAAYFAGLDIPVYQAHSEYFSRYPLGREATMGFPAPDLRIRNNSPHGILVWTSYSDTSLTVTLYSTPYATGEQTGITDSMSGQCRVVVTTRTRTFPDGHTENDTFRATYRPGPGEFC